MATTDTGDEVATFVARVRPDLERALVARFGLHDGLEAASVAVGYAFENWGRLVSMGNPGGYLYRVGVSSARRSSSRRWRTEVLVGEPLTVDQPVDVDLQRALARLRPDQRVAVVLVYAHGHSYADAAEARSQVSRVVAGPAGFVAIGMGFDDGRNHGRVWHSTDRLVWGEPAFDLFDPKGVGSIAATADAYFVVAGTNPDRLGLGEGASSPDLQLFRSADGRSWEPWGEPWGNSGAVASTDDVLLRSPEPGLLEWSADGVEWTTATFPDGPVDGAYFDMFGGAVQDGDFAYLRGFVADAFAVWSSTDGRSWQQLPTPPAGGTIAAVPDGIVMVTNPREQECAELSGRQFDNGEAGSIPPDADDLESAADAQWTCTAEPDVHRFDADSGTWSLDAHHLGDTPVIPSITRLSNTLVVPLLEPTKALTIWTAAVDTLEWTEQTPTRLEYIDNTGSPGMAAIAASEDSVVVFTEDRMVDGHTVITVGNLQPASG